MNKKIVTVVGLLVFAFAAAYLGSPFWAIYQFKQAALSADVDRLDAAVDFPAVRESLKSELTVALTTKMTTDPAMKNNPFAGLGMMMMPAFINRMVDGFVTAEGISALVKQGQVTNKANPQPAKTDVDYSYDYRSLDRFAVSVQSKDTKTTEAPAFVFARQGLFSWRMIRLDVPASAFDAKK